MAAPVTITTAQKAPLRVTDPATGTLLSPAEFGPYTTITSGNAVIETTADAVFVAPKVDSTGAVLTGVAAISVRLSDGRGGNTSIIITAAPLVVEIGDPVPR